MNDKNMALIDALMMLKQVVSPNHPLCVFIIVEGTEVRIESCFREDRVKTYERDNPKMSRSYTG